MRRCAATAFFVALLLLPATASQLGGTAPPGRLIVQVSNGTSDGTPIVGDRVFVQLYRNRGQTLVSSLEGVVGETGEAVFDPVPTGPDLMAVARAQHENMAFGGPPVALDSPTGDTVLPVTVYDVSTDASGLAVGIHHIIIALQGESLEFTEHFQLANNSDMAILGDKRDVQDKPMVIDVGLPEGYRNLQALDYFEPHALVTTPAGFYDTMAVPPGNHQVTFSYQLGIEDSPVSVDRRIALPTAQLLIFWQGTQGAVEGLGEPDGQMTNADGIPMTYFKRTNLTGGDEIHFEISGLNPASTSDSKTLVILGVVFVAVAVVAVLRLRSGSGQDRSSS